MFLLHNRGELIAIYGLSVLGGNELGPIVNGPKEVRIRIDIETRFEDAEGQSSISAEDSVRERRQDVQKVV